MKRNPSFRIGKTAAWCTRVVFRVCLGSFTRNLRLGCKSGHFFWLLMNSSYTQLFLKLDQHKKFWKQHTPIPELVWSRTQACSTSHNCTAPSPAQTTPLLPEMMKWNLSLCTTTSNAEETCSLPNPRFYFQTDTVSTDPAPRGDGWAGCTPQIPGSLQTTNTTLSIPLTAASQQQAVFPFAAIEMNCFFTDSTHWLQNYSQKNQTFRANMDSWGTRSWETKSTGNKSLLNFC